MTAYKVMGVLKLTIQFIGFIAIIVVLTILAGLFVGIDPWYLR